MISYTRSINACCIIKVENMNMFPFTVRNPPGRTVLPAFKPKPGYGTYHTYIIQYW